MTSTDDGNMVIELTGNPLADLQMLYEMLMSGATPFSLPTSMDAGTAFQLVDSEYHIKQGTRCRRACSRWQLHACT